MPDDTRPKHPMPKIPDVASFMRQFSDDDACAAHLRDNAGVRIWNDSYVPTAVTTTAGGFRRAGS